MFTPSICLESTFAPNKTTMQQIISTLIQDEIKLNRLVRTLDKLDIEATTYLPNNAVVIFELLKLNERPDYEKLLDEYFTRIERFESSEEMVEWLTSI